MKFCFNKRQTSVRKYCTTVLRLAFIVVKPLSNAPSYGLFYLAQINKSKITCNRAVLHSNMHMKPLMPRSSTEALVCIFILKASHSYISQPYLICHCLDFDWICNNPALKCQGNIFIQNNKRLWSSVVSHYSSKHLTLKEQHVI